MLKSERIEIVNMTLAEIVLDPHIDNNRTVTIRVGRLRETFDRLNQLTGRVTLLEAENNRMTKALERISSRIYLLSQAEMFRIAEDALAPDAESGNGGAAGG